MRRRVLVALGAALLWLPVADNLPAAEPPGADWSRPHSIQSGDITVYYPRAWTASVEETTIVVRSGSTRIMLVDYGTTPGGLLPAAARSLRRWTTMIAASFPALGFEGWNLIFTDRGQVVQAFVKLGSNTPKSDAAEVLDRVEIG